jgi:hypothetical protein
MVRADIVKLNNELEGVRVLEKIISCVQHGGRVQINANGATYNVVAGNELFRAFVERADAINKHISSLSLS